MRGAVRTLIGMAMIAAGVLLAAWALYELIRIGTCASGGPYVSARECPPGTGTKIFGLLGGIFLTLIGAVVVPGAAIAGVAWGLGFTMLGGAFLVAGFGPAAPEDDEIRWVGAFVGGLFVLMGLPGLFAILAAGRRGGGRARHLLQHGKRCQGTVLSVDDTGVTINDNPRVTMRVRAEPPGEPAFEFEKTATVSRVKIPRQGDRCAVFYDPAGGGEPGISFDGPALAMVGLSPSGGPLSTAASPAMGVGTPGVVPVTPAPSAPAAVPADASASIDADDDTIAELERLAKLRAAGALTEAEFQQAKARVLGT